MTLTHRDRMKLVLSHEKPDRTPAVLAGRPEVDRALVAHFGVAGMDDVHRILGTDGWDQVAIGLSFPEFDARANGTLQGDFPYAGNPMILHGDSVFEDAWGVVRKVGSDGKYVQWISGPLQGAATPGEYDFPGPERIVENADIRADVERRKRDGLWVSGYVSQPFKTAWELRGLENLLADYAVNPDFVEGLYDRIYRLHGEMARRLTSAGIDMLHIGGDIAMQDRLFMGPDRWRRIDRPRLARLIASCRAVNPGLHVFIHSDGNLTEVMDDLVEIGFDVVDPIQPECMDPVAVKRRYGDRITLHGCGSLQRTLPFGTPEQCRQEVRDLIRNCGYNGGLVLRVSNAIGFNVPIANIVAWFEEARDFDMASL